MGSCHTVPVKYSEDAFFVGRVPDLICPYCSPRLATFVAKKKIQIYDFVFLGW